MDEYDERYVSKVLDAISELAENLGLYQREREVYQDAVEPHASELSEVLLQSTWIQWGSDGDDSEFREWWEAHMVTDPYVAARLEQLKEDNYGHPTKFCFTITEHKDPTVPPAEYWWRIFPPNSDVVIFKQATTVEDGTIYLLPGWSEIVFIPRSELGDFPKVRFEEVI
jgi:hypothetical protein